MTTANGRLPKPARRGNQPTSTVVMLLFCVYLIAWFLQLGQRVEVLGVLRFELVLGSLLAVLAVLALVSRPIALGVLEKQVVVWAGTLLLIMAVMVPFSANHSVSSHVFIERGVKFAFMAIFIVAFVRTGRDLRWFLAAFLIACGYICQESLRGAITGSMVWESQGIPRLHGDTLLFRHPNSLAGLALGVIPFAFFCMLAFTSRFARASLLCLIVVAVAVIMYTGSRTSYVGFVAMLAFVLAISGVRFARIVLLTAASLTVLGLVMPQEYKARFETLLTGQDIEGNSMASRRQIISDAIAIAVDRPLGVGVGAFPAVRMERFGRFQDTHNLYLEVTTNLGWIGLIVFLAFVRAIWRSLGNSRRKLIESSASSASDAVWSGGSTADPDRRVMLAIVCASHTYLFARLVVGLFGHDLYEIYWWLSSGVAVSVGAMIVAEGRGGGQLLGIRRGSASV